MPKPKFEGEFKMTPAAVEKATAAPAPVPAGVGFASLPKGKTLTGPTGKLIVPDTTDVEFVEDDAGRKVVTSPDYLAGAIFE